MVDSVNPSARLATPIASPARSAAGAAGAPLAATEATLSAGTDLLSVQDLPARVAQAAEQARQAQRQVQRAQSTERGLRNLEPQLRQLRDLARQASSAGLSSQARAELSARFSALQTRANIEATAALGGADVQRLLAPGAAASTDTSQARVTVTGTAQVGGERVGEQGAALATSRVAGSRGVVAVRAAVSRGTAVFRFEDTGNGQVRATRFEKQGDQLVEVGSQTVAVPNLRGQRLAGGQSATLQFGRLGLTLELGARYATGDLAAIELDAAAPATTAATLDAAQADQATGLTFDIGQATGAQSAAAALDRMIGQSAQLRRELRADEAAQRQTALASLQAAETTGATAGLTGDTAPSAVASLRALLLQQSTGALSAQARLDGQRAAQLLS